MPVKDLYHDMVRDALRKDGWRITHNPLPFPRRRKAAAAPAPVPDDAEEEWLLAAEKDERKIAVAVKSFVGRSDPESLARELAHLARCRARLYTTALARPLYLAIRRATYEACFATQEEAQAAMPPSVLLLVFDPRTAEIVHWGAVD